MRERSRPLTTAPEAWLPDAWIIEEELRREREREEPRPYLELPLPAPAYTDEPRPAPGEPRGVIIIPL